MCNFQTLIDLICDVLFQTLVDLICDVKQMEEAVVEMQYDCKKAPLGNIYSSIPFHFNGLSQYILVQ